MFGLKVSQPTPVSPNVAWCFNQPRQRWPSFATRSICIIAYKLIALPVWMQCRLYRIDLSKCNSLLEATTTIILKDKKTFVKNENIFTFINVFQLLFDYLLYVVARKLYNVDKTRKHCWRRWCRIQLRSPYLYCVNRMTSQVLITSDCHKSSLH